MVLRCRPMTRAIIAGRRPRWRSNPKVYLSAEVTWQYIIGSFLSWRRTEAYRAARSPYLLGHVLHLAYESALSNRRLH